MIIESGVEVQAIPTPAVPEPVAVVSTNASSTRFIVVSATHPALVELHPVAHCGRANQQQHEIEVAEIKEIALDLPNVGSLIVGEMGPAQLRINKSKSTPFALRKTMKGNTMKDKTMKGERTILIAAAMGFALAITGCEKATHAAVPAKPPSVPVAEVIVRPVTPMVEFTGSLTAVKRVELRPRVAGYIQDVSVPEGRFVEKGRELFRIDPRVFQAALTAATAHLREAEAASLLAQAEHARAEQLFALKIVARERVDTATAALNARQAQVSAAKAAVDTAELDLSFTRVTAPISGRVGQALVTEGNYVASGVTPLTTIVSIDPLHVDFDVDERTYLQSLAAGRANAAPQGSKAAKVMVALLTDKSYSRPGRVNFLSNTADRGTGTVRVRAVIDNPDGQLTPGLFAKVKLETGAPQVRVLVSDQSIGTDQGRRYVLVVGKDDKTEYRPVEIGPVVDGLRVIEQGLQPGERLVVKGLVRPGMQVTPQSAAIDGTPALPQTTGAAK